MTDDSNRGRDDAPPQTRHAALSWTTPWQALALFCRGRTFFAAAPVAVVVGTILSLVNQLHVVLDGDATWATWVRVSVNYAVPYIVASIGYLSACRLPRDT